MKVVQINSVCGSGSTGKICVAISEMLKINEIENYILYAYGNSNYPYGKRYMSRFEIKIQSFKSRVFGNYGFQTKRATKKLIMELEMISPDVIHLHNLHSHNVNLEILFTYIKKKNIKVFWTFHDCWAFTGYCPHYSMIGCDQWKEEGCFKCPQKRRYSWIFDNSRGLYEKKKRLLTDLNLTIITPSKWMAEQVKQSFLKEHDIKVIHNGINLSVFQPKTSLFRENNRLLNKYIILGVAYGWGERKGLDVFVELEKRLDKQYQIVLVGTSETIEKKLPKGILCIRRTQNQEELAEIYSTADIFVNPTREENYPTVNMESIACGTPVLTFNTGGSPECIDGTSGIIVPRDDIDSLEKEIIRICTTKPYSKENCIARAKNFSEKEKYLEYIDLYMQVQNHTNRGQ